MTFTVESVANNIRVYEDILNQYEACYKQDPFFDDVEIAVIELYTLGDFITLQEELDMELIYHDNTIMIYDGYIE